jgi:hypothetical protein
MPRLVMLVKGMILSIALLLPVAAQGPNATGDDAMSVLIEVMRHRLTWMEDRTAFDPCSLYLHGGQPANLPEVVPRDVRELVGTLADGMVPAVCADRVALARALPERVVEIEGVTLGDSVARVRIHVRKGELNHSESYSLRRGVVGGWAVIRVEQFDYLQVTPPRTGASG